MNVAVPLSPTYAFMAWTGTALPLLFIQEAVPLWGPTG